MGPPVVMGIYYGKNGSDAIARVFVRICIIVQKYGPKLRAAIQTAESAGLITGPQVTAAFAFIDGSSALCDIFKLVAGNSGFPNSG